MIIMTFFLKRILFLGFNLMCLIVMVLQCSIAFAQDINSKYQKNDWDYSLGSEYSKPAYTPLKKIESEVLYFPYIAHQQVTDTTSTMNSDFYVYIMPETIFGIETLELMFDEKVAKIESTVEVESLAKEIEEAIPLIFKDAVKKEEEKPRFSHKYGLRIKAQIKKDSISINEKEKFEKDIQEKNKGPQEREIDVLVNIIFGQNKIIIKIPPLKDPKEKERLIKELERIAHILARQDDLVDINQVSD